MPNRNYTRKDITIKKKYKFRLEIYPSIVAWEIFPHDYQSSLYAFSNKDNLNKFIETNHIFQKWYYLKQNG